MSDQTLKATALLQYLPSTLQNDEILGRFLLAFEEILFGQTENKRENDGLEKAIAKIPEFFDPITTPEDFLPWLADWVAFSLWKSPDLETQRKFIANMTELYRWRGTELGLILLFNIFTDRTPKFSDTGTNNHFQIEVELSDIKDGEKRIEAEAVAYVLIDLAKPAHISYTLVFKTK